MDTKKPKFTPGPWSICLTTLNGILAADSGGLMVKRAEAFGSTSDEIDANAALIAASPDLYEALRVIATQSLGPDWTAEQAYTFMRQHARAALAKAEGR